MRTLKVKCPTWKHVETFYKRKLRRDKTLTIRVPFNPAEGSGLTIRLQLPDGQILNIEGKVLGVLPGESANKAAITLHLHGFTDEIAQTLNELVKSGNQEAIVQRPSGDDAVAITSRPPRPDHQEPAPRKPVRPEPPSAEPRDAPINELVAVPQEPNVESISEFEREVFEQLQSELLNLREFAAHEVLCIEPDASVEEIRKGYFARTKHFHPDVYSRYRSPAIMHMAQEVFIHINKAYDRMRDVAVAEGRAVVAGPALLPHDGWLASIDDITSYEPEATGASPKSHAGGGASQAIEQVREAAEEVMRSGDYEGARSLVASALHGDPRNRQLRSLYYYIGGQQALAQGDTVLAASQFEAALAHDRDYQQARTALDQLRASGEHGGGTPKSLR